MAIHIRLIYPYPCPSPSLFLRLLLSFSLACLSLSVTVPFLVHTRCVQLTGAQSFLRQRCAHTHPIVCTSRCILSYHHHTSGVSTPFSMLISPPVLFKQYIVRLPAYRTTNSLSFSLSSSHIPHCLGCEVCLQSGSHWKSGDSTWFTYTYSFIHTRCLLIVYTLIDGVCRRNARTCTRLFLAEEETSRATTGEGGRAGRDDKGRDGRRD